MPNISSLRKTITVPILEMEGAEVKMYLNLTIADANELKNIPEEKRMIFICLRLMHSWNLDDPIDENSLMQLSFAQLDNLLSNTEFYQQAKKTLEEKEDAAIEKKIV